MTLILSLLLACTGGDKDDTAGADDTSATDDSGGPPPDYVTDCSTTACGGDPSGEWTISDVCFSSDPQPLDSSDCPDGTVTVLDLRMEGTAVLNTDGTYTRALTMFETDILAHVPDSCTSGLSCDIIQGFIEEKLPGIVCTDAGTGDGCDCNVTLVGDPSVENGTWTTADTTMTSTPDDGSASTDTPYCSDIDETWIEIPTDNGTISVLYTRDAG